MDSRPELKPLESGSTSRALFNGTVLVAAVPAVIFLFSYCYEFGYAYTFGTPLQLVSVGWGTALIATGLFVFVAQVWLVLADVVLGFLAARPIAFPVLDLLPLFLFVVTMAVLSSGEWRVQIFLGLLLVVAVVMGILLYRRGEARLKSARPGELEGMMRSPFRYYRRRIAGSPYFAIVIAGFSVMVSLQLGRFSASRQTEFYVTPGAPQRVLLAKYGNTFILEHFDRKTRKLGGRIIVLKLADGSPLALEREDVGPLTAPDER